MRSPCVKAARHYSAPMAGSEILAVGAAELSVVLVLLCVIVVPVAAIAFARSGKGYSEIGKGRFAVDYGESSEHEEREEVRQLVEAKAYRQSQRGEVPLDVETEIERLLSEDPTAGAGETPEDPETAQMRDEIRQVVIAKNESRRRRGEEPLDVESEVERMLSEFR